MSALTVKDLVLSPGGDFVTEPLELTVERGEILCLVGPSGCGKTTLIRALAGLLAPREGRIELDGRVLNDPEVRVPAGRRRVGMVFQNLALWPHMKALAQVRYAAGRGGSRAKAQELLRLVGLAGREKARPHQLSGGEGQRVALARALAGDPLLLLLDEPLRSVDPHLRADLGKMLREVVRERRPACILVTHDRDEALALGDRVAVMRAGRILASGTPATLLEEPPDPFTASFLKEGITPPPVAGGTPPGEGGGRGRQGPGPAARLGLFLAAAGLAAAAVSSFAGGPGVRSEPPTFRTSADCEPCHREVYAEWRESWHAKAWTDPEVRRLTNNFSNKQCLSCHTPLPILVTGIGQRALERKTLLKEGVNCFSCHLDEKGRIVGTRDVPSAPCAPVKNKWLATNEICAPCHNQHFTLDQWEESPARARGENCSYCHMPVVTRRLADGTTGEGRSHLTKGGQFPAYVRTAVALEAKWEEGRLVMAVTNTFGGHNFPTDSRHKASDLLVRYLQGGKWGAWRRVARFRNPYREEPGPNTQIPAGERVEFAERPPAGAIQAEVRLDFRATPYVPDAGAVEWHEEKYLTPRRAVVLHRKKIDLK